MKCKMSHKEPRLMKKVISEVETHPSFSSLPLKIRQTFHLFIVRSEDEGILPTPKHVVSECNHWIRELWRHLYRNEPIPLI